MNRTGGVYNFGPYLFCPVLQIFLPCLLAAETSSIHQVLHQGVKAHAADLFRVRRQLLPGWWVSGLQHVLFQNGAETKVVPFTPLLCKRWCLTILEHRFDDFWWLQKLKLYLWGEGLILNNVNCLPSRYPAQNPVHQFKYFSQLGALVVHLAVPLGSAPNSGHLHRSKTWPGSFHSLIFWGWWPGGWPSWTSRPLWLSHWHTLGCQPSKWWYFSAVYEFLCLNFAPHPKIHQNPPCQCPLEGCTQGFGYLQTWFWVYQKWPPSGRLGWVRWPHHCDDQHAGLSEAWTNWCAASMRKGIRRRTVNAYITWLHDPTPALPEERCWYSSSEPRRWTWDVHSQGLEWSSRCIEVCQLTYFFVPNLLRVQRSEASKNRSRVLDFNAILQVYPEIWHFFSQMDFQQYFCWDKSSAIPIRKQSRLPELYTAVV